MLHIIWGMIKIIGVVLLILLLLLLILLLSVLFVPIRYQGKFYKEQETAYVQGKVSWLFHAISGRVRYQKGSELQWDIRILGISIETLGNFIKKIKGLKTPKKEVSKEKKTPITDKEAKSVAQALEEKPSKPSEKKKSKISGLLELPGKIKKAIQNIALILKGICDKINSLHTFLQSEEFKGAVAVVLSEGKGAIGHIRPRTIKGSVRFGFEDPSLTGQLLGVISLCYPWYHKTLQIYPYFDRKILEGDCILKGRICVGKLALIALRLYRNQNIKTVIKQVTK